MCPTYINCLSVVQYREFLLITAFYSYLCVVFFNDNLYVVMGLWLAIASNVFERAVHTEREIQC